MPLLLGPCFSGPPLPGVRSNAAWTLWIGLVTVLPGSCVLWVSQPHEVHTQEGATALLPCSFNASQGSRAIGSVTWYRDEVASGKEVTNRTPEFRGRVGPLAAPRFLFDHPAKLHIWDIRDSDVGVYVCRVEVLGLGAGTGSGTWFLLARRDARLALVLHARLYTFSFLCVALGSVLCCQGRGPCHLGTRCCSLDSPCGVTQGPSDPR
ncbi:natural cytotoxicity triggering receptor 3 [Ctenodactylus gundi]